ncbi:hypothetical protein GCM10010254_03260 [Streptomyces chromofuscus]|nr:hypothetical protein GCM10010254_03260 [Streptomyces chromofuscus]
MDAPFGGAEDGERETEPGRDERTPGSTKRQVRRPVCGRSSAAAFSVTGDPYGRN